MKKYHPSQTEVRWRAWSPLSVKDLRWVNSHLFKMEHFSWRGDQLILPFIIIYFVRKITSWEMKMALKLWNEELPAPNDQRAVSQLCPTTSQLPSSDLVLYDSNLKLWVRFFASVLQHPCTHLLQKVLTSASWMNDTVNISNHIVFRNAPQYQQGWHKVKDTITVRDLIRSPIPTPVTNPNSSIPMHSVGLLQARVSMTRLWPLIFESKWVSPTSHFEW